MDNLLKNVILTPFNLLYRVSPKLTLQILFRLKVGYPLNLDDPKTYNEKLQWIKLYDHNPLMPKCCDKFLVRDYVKSKGCGEILNELLWEGFDPKEIPFDDLPKKFVIKATHGSTFNIICTDKSKLDRKETISKCQKWLKTKFLLAYGEWYYGCEKPRIIVEKYLDNLTGMLPEDYKVFCFNGEPAYVAVDTDRSTQHKRNFYDLEWNFLSDVNTHFDHDTPIEKPTELDALLKYARILSESFHHVRVDFYIIKGQIIFGELNFANGAGFSPIRPVSFDYKLGSLLHLPNKT